MTKNLPPRPGPARLLVVLTPLTCVLLSLACGSKDKPPAPKALEPAKPVAPAPAKSTLAVSDPASPKVEELTRILIAGADRPAAAARQILTRLHDALEPVDPYDPLMRTALSPNAAAAALLALEPGKKFKITGIEGGALMLACVRALGLRAAPVVLPHAGKGATSLRHRDLGALVDLKAVDGVLAPTAGPAATPTKIKSLADGAALALLKALDAIHKVETNDLKEATRLMTEAANALPGDQALKFLLGQITVLNGASEAGMDMMQKAVDKAEDAEGRHQMGVALLREEQNFAAYQSFEKAVKLDPTHSEAWSAMGQITLDRLSAVPEEQQAFVEKELDRIEEAMGKLGKGAPGLLELRMQRLLMKRETEKARKLGVEALNIYPHRPTLHILMAEIALGNGERAKALRHFERAAESDPYDAEPLLQVAQMYAEDDKVDQALGALEEAAQRAPYDPSILAQLASAYQQVNRLKDATDIATKLRDRFPNVLAGSLLLAQLALSEGNAVGAALIAEQALQKHPKEPTLYTMLYVTHSMSNQHAQADEVLTRMLAVFPDGRLRLAQELLQSGQIEASAALLEAELDANPKSADAAVVLGQLYHLGGKKAEVDRIRAHIIKHVDNKAEVMKLFEDSLKALGEQAAEPPPGQPATPDGADDTGAPQGQPAAPQQL